MTPPHDDEDLGQLIAEGTVDETEEVDEEEAVRLDNEEYAEGVAYQFVMD